MASGFRFAVLGPVRAWCDGAEVSLGNPQQRAVLAFMLLRAGAHTSPEELVDALWPDDPPKAAVGTIRTYVHRLRKVLGGEELLRSSGRGYVVDLREEDLDLSRFRRLSDQARRASAEADLASAARYLSEGLALWNGIPLAGITGRFAETQRALLEETRLTAIEARAEHNLTLGNLADVIPELTAVARERTYRERPRELLMLALYRAGRQAEALAVFDEVRHLFTTELGIDPGPRLRDVQLRILNADPSLMAVWPSGPSNDASALSPGPSADGEEDAGNDLRTVPPDPGASGRWPLAPPAQLPRDLPSFAGRTADLEFVLAGCTDEAGAGSVTVIAGMAGVGKTALAVHAAHLLADRFPDGQLYVDLRGFDRSGLVLSHEEAIRQLLVGLGVLPEQVPAGVEAQIGLYRSVLAGRRVLVVLDNARNAEQVRPLLPGDSRCRVLVTSRDQMRSLIAIDGARMVALSLLSRDDARAILSRRVGTERVAAEGGAVERLIALCAGLPLALSVVAARAVVYATRSLSSLAAELSESGNSLNALADPDSVIDARASLALSYRTLSPNAARLLRLSALHPGAVSGREAMASLAGISVPEAVAGLDELERVHLVTQPEPSYYASHELVRAYAAELAGADRGDDLDAARQRMFDHYRQSAYEAMGVLRRSRSPVEVAAALPGVTVAHFDDPQDAFGWFARAYPVLRALLDQTAELGLPEYTWQLAWALDPFHNSQARWQDKLAVHRTALAAAEKLGNLALQGHSHRNLGQAYRHLGEARQAREHYDRAQRLYDDLGDKADQARNLSHIVACMNSGDSPEQAKEYALRALELSIEAQDRELEAVALNNLACSLSLGGDQAAAIERAEQALALLDQAGDLDFRAYVLCTLGQSQYRAGDYRQAAAHLVEALGIFRVQHDRFEQVNTLRLLAITQRRAGRLPAARQAWQAALPILSALGHDLPSFDPFTSPDTIETW
jgi:DNA-binding SARP family transcriptional activator/tetratricopeptide (TPR) repeat protein